MGTNAGRDIAASDTISIGTGSLASADDAIAIGRDTSAGFANSAAFGAGATTTRAGQQVFGTATNTYTMPGITSAASRAAQSGPVELVTTDAAGNLASTGIEDLVMGSDVGDEIARNTEGVAMGLAMAGAFLPQPGETVRMSGNWGNFEGSNALAFNGAALVGPGTYLTGGIGAGLDEGTVGGRAGISFGW
jgi:hypothetical protein